MAIELAVGAHFLAIDRQFLFCGDGHAYLKYLHILKRVYNIWYDKKTGYNKNVFSIRASKWVRY